MQPFETQDGKKFTNRDSWRQHKASLDSRAPMQKMPAEGEPDGDEQDGAAVAAEHGPANEVHIEHEHEMGVHHVHSMHPDGHEHHSDHASAEEAHDHGKKLATGGEEHEEPDGDEGQMAEMGM